MASARHLKALIESFTEGDDDRFYSVAMQVAAHEAKLGHGKLATDLREIIDSGKRTRRKGNLELISSPRGELSGLLTVVQPKIRLNDMVLKQDLLEQLERIIREQRHAEKILGAGLEPRRKVLLVGPPGTGKTMTASVLASELGLPLYEVRLDGLITKFMGETAAKLRQIFDSTNRIRGVYLFDEFDAIGAQRSLSNDVGEVRRILNSFLRMIEQDNSHSLIVAATNHPNLLDNALFRRFDDVLHYELPTEQQSCRILKRRLESYIAGKTDWKELAKYAKGLSFAELTRATGEVIKRVLIESRESATEQDVREAIDERIQMSGRQKEIE